MHGRSVGQRSRFSQGCAIAEGQNRRASRHRRVLTLRKGYSRATKHSTTSRRLRMVSSRRLVAPHRRRISITLPRAPNNAKGPFQSVMPGSKHAAKMLPYTASGSGVTRAPTFRKEGHWPVWKCEHNNQRPICCPA